MTEWETRLVLISLLSTSCRLSVDPCHVSPAQMPCQTSPSNRASLIQIVRRRWGWKRIHDCRQAPAACWAPPRGIARRRFESDAQDHARWWCCTADRSGSDMSVQKSRRGCIWESQYEKMHSESVAPWSDIAQSEVRVSGPGSLEARRLPMLPRGNLH